MPVALVHYVRHVHALPARVVILHVAFEHVPRVAVADRVTVEPLGEGLDRITVRAGFMEKPSLPDRLRECPASGPLGLDAGDATDFIGRKTFLATSRGEMGRFSESIFSILYEVSSSATSYFSLPPEQVMDIDL